MPTRKCLNIALAWLTLVLGPTAPLADARVGATTALEEYVYTPDPAYSYKLLTTLDRPGFTAYVLIMDSLKWRGGDEVDRRLWTHQIIIVVPDVVTHTTALMVVNGDSNPNNPPDEFILGIGALLGVSTESVVAAVSQIPNQPLQFVDEPAPIREDALVAYSWDKSMATGDPTWAAYLPMTKASVRGLDAVQSFVNESVANVRIDDFVVTGFSKRGATAWLVAAVDPRVRAVAPGVFDVLNMPLQIERHYRSYGFYSAAIEDYVNYDIVGRVRSPEGQALTRIVDPLSYVATLELPKLLLNATGDQFFLPDAANFYVDRLPGETLIRQVPNTDHGFTNGIVDVLNALQSWYRTTLTGAPRPSVSWAFDDAGVLTVNSDPPAASASLWEATNPEARDFRLDTIGAQWHDNPLVPVAPGTYQVTVAAPAAGYTGYLVALTFAGDAPQAIYGTPVFVTPDTLPFELDDPVGAPRPSRYWRCQLAAAGSACPAPDFTAAELEALLPLPVFGVYLNDLDALAEALERPSDLAGGARLACVATRLNIAAGELGWYSKAADQSRVWEVYADAEQRLAEGQPHQASRLCAQLNRLKAPTPLPQARRMYSLTRQ